MVELQENPSFNTQEIRDYLPQSEIINSDQGSPRTNPASREREVVRKGS